MKKICRKIIELVGGGGGGGGGGVEIFWVTAQKDGATLNYLFSLS